MLTHPEASLLATELFAQVLTDIHNPGVGFPALTFVNKGRPFETPKGLPEDSLELDEDKFVIRARRSYRKWNLPLEQDLVDNHDPEVMHAFSVKTRLKEDSDEMGIQKLADRVTKERRPDMVALQIPVFYNEYSRNEASPGEIAHDPETIICVAAFYYLRTHPVGMMCHCPLTDLGEMPVDDIDWTPQVTHPAFLAGSGWFPVSSNQDLKLARPYR